MKDEEYFRAGIFTCEGKDYTFALKDFRFLIMNPSKDSIHALPHNGSERLHSDANGIIAAQLMIITLLQFTHLIIVVTLMDIIYCVQIAI